MIFVVLLTILTLFYTGSADSEDSGLGTTLLTFDYVLLFLSEVLPELTQAQTKQSKPINISIPKKIGKGGPLSFSAIYC